MHKISHLHVPLSKFCHLQTQSVSPSDSWMCRSSLLTASSAGLRPCPLGWHSDLLTDIRTLSPPSSSPWIVSCKGILHSAASGFGLLHGFYFLSSGVQASHLHIQACHRISLWKPKLLPGITCTFSPAVSPFSIHSSLLIYFLQCSSIPRRNVVSFPLLNQITKNRVHEVRPFLGSLSWQLLHYNVSVHLPTS